MLSLHATAHPTPLLAPTPLPGGAPPTPDATATPSTFARMLQGSQPPAAASAPPPPAQRATDQQAPARQGDPADPATASKPVNAEPAAHGAAPTPPPQAGPSATAAPARDTARGRDDTRRTQAAATQAAHTRQAAATQAEGEKRAAAAKDDLADAKDPALADWLASLKLPDPLPPAPPEASPPATDASAATTPLPDAATCTAGARGPDRHDAAVTLGAGQAAMAALADGMPARASQESGSATAGRERAADLPARGTGPDPADTAGTPGTPLSAAQARPGSGGDQAPSGGGSDSRNPSAPAWTPVASASATEVTLPPAPVATVTVQPGRTAAEPVAVKLPVPVDSPAFPRAMGVELSVLARDGIEHAELHLSPAEMGPVSVQIAIDGTQARIDFGADVAATRQAIEAGLPELASALREAGLTLTGGGVSQHSRGQQNPADPAAAGRGNGGPADAGTGEAAAPPPRRFVRAGGVDMYA